MGAESLGRAAAAQGFAILQLAPAKVLPDCPPLPEPMDAEWAAGVRRSLGLSGVRVAVLGCYVDVCGPDDERRELAVRRLSHNLSLAAAFGSPVVATETPLSGGDARECLGRLREELGRLLPEAEAARVALCVEPVMGHAVSTPRAMRDLADELASPALGVILDPVNLVDPGSRADPCGPALEAVEILGGLIKAVHVKDFVVEGGEKRVARIGSGYMDWSRVVPLIAAAAPGAPFIIEDQDSEGRAAGLKLLSS